MGGDARQDGAERGEVILAQHAKKALAHER
jgi:hypothetical protein